MVKTINHIKNAAPSIPKRRGSVAARHDKSKCRGTGDCEVVVMGLPFGTPATLVQEYLNEMMVHHFICPSDSPPIVNCWLEGFHTARYAVLVFASAKLATRALDFNGIPFLMEILDIHRRHEYEGPHPHHSSSKFSQLLPDKYLPEGKERERWMKKLDDLFNRYVWVEPAEVGLESEEEYNRKLLCPSSTKYYGTEVGREKTTQKAEKVVVVDGKHELRRTQHHTKQPNEQPSPERKEGVRSVQLLDGEESKHDDRNQEYILAEEEMLDASTDILEENSSCCSLPSEQSLEDGSVGEDFCAGMQEELLRVIFPAETVTPPDWSDHGSVTSLRQLIIEEKNKQENGIFDSISLRDVMLEVFSQIADLVGDDIPEWSLSPGQSLEACPITDNKGLTDTSPEEKEGRGGSNHSGGELEVGSSSSTPLVGEWSGLSATVSMDEERECASHTSTDSTAYNQYAMLVTPTTTGQQFHPNDGDDASQPSPCPPTKRNSLQVSEDVVRRRGSIHNGGELELGSGSSTPLVGEWLGLSAVVSMDEEREFASHTSTGSTAYRQYARLLSPTATWQYHPRVKDDASQPLCPPTKHDSLHVTLPNKKILSCSETFNNLHQAPNDAPIMTTNTGSLVGVRESGRLPWPRTPHTVRRRKTRKSQSRLYVRVFQQLGVKLGVMNDTYNPGRANCKREMMHWRMDVDEIFTTKSNVARIVGALADDRLDEIVCHFRKKGI